MTTERRQEYIRAIDGYFRRNDQLPSCPKLAELMGTTPNAAFEIYTKLERAGVVERNEQGKFKRGPQWPHQEESCDSHEQGEQTRPVHIARSGTYSTLGFKANSSWLPSALCNKTPEKATCDCTRSTPRGVSYPAESWYSKIPQH